ncbi:MAG: pyridoxamine 5'-phosphate oxidase family protein [Candidatus Hydrothermarchaeales archaeon]
MKRLTDEIIGFFQNQAFVIVSTVDKNGSLHNSCKGIVKINSSGSIYLLDLYKGRAFENLERNPHISITAVDEHSFIGFCLKGKAKIIAGKELKSQIIKAWEDRITSRITRRVIKNIQGEKGHSRHPEALLPKPEYLIVMDVEETVSLIPQHIKQVD